MKKVLTTTLLAATLVSGMACAVRCRYSLG